MMVVPEKFSLSHKTLELKRCIVFVCLLLFFLVGGGDGSVDHAFVLIVVLFGCF